jgi:hypothetical protein
LDISRVSKVLEAALFGVTAVISRFCFAVQGPSARDSKTSLLAQPLSKRSKSPTKATFSYLDCKGKGWLVI